MKKHTAIIGFSLILNLVYGQDGKSTLDNYYTLLRKSFNAKNAYETVGFVEQRWRLPGNSGFNESVFYVEKILRNAGFTKERDNEKEGTLTYRIEKREMRDPTWEPVDASVRLGDDQEPLLIFSANRNMLAINSASTPSTGTTAEIVYVGAGTKNDFEGKDVKDKIVFGETFVSSLYKTAIEKGAAGVFAYSLPQYNQPSKHVNSIQFQRIPFSNSSEQKWAILLSYSAKEKLKSALLKGSVLATVKIVSRIYKAEELTLVANVRGKSLPEERFVFSAHVQEPGANDNATGVGTLAEMARVTADFVKQKKLTPERTITFLWGDEIVSTRRYIAENAKEKNIKWGLSLDMVGEDVSKTGGTFLIEKMPDPSAIWTRGKEKHSEWGGSPLKESQMFPHYFNDFILNRCNQQAKENGWVVKTNPFEGGSDHTPFLDAKIPGALMWHFTDVFYHTDSDRLNMVSGDEMRNVGISALACAFTLCSANEETTLYLIDELKTNALERLSTEFELSKEAAKNGGEIESEKHILEVWASYYVDAFEKMLDIKAGGSTERIKDRIEHAQNEVKTTSKDLVSLISK